MSATTKIVGACTCVDMRHPIEIFDTPAHGRMAAALNAAVTTLGLAGLEPDDIIRWEMARRILSAARGGASTPLELVEAALDGRWSAARESDAGMLPARRDPSETNVV